MQKVSLHQISPQICTSPLKTYTNNEEKKHVIIVLSVIQFIAAKSKQQNHQNNNNNKIENKNKMHTLTYRQTKTILSIHGIWKCFSQYSKVMVHTSPADRCLLDVPAIPLFN